MNALTTSLLKDVTALEERVNNNPSVPRDMLLFLPVDLIDTPQGVESINLAKAIRDAQVGSNVTITVNEDFVFNSHEGLNISIGVSKDTNFDGLRDVLRSFESTTD